MIKRVKRNYIFVIMMSCFMIFTVAFTLIKFEQAFSYGETNGIIRSVDVRQVESGSYDDRTYYTESTVKYDYTIGGREYSGTTDLRADYTGREREQVTIIYDKHNPRKSSIGSRDLSLCTGIIAIISSVILLIYIIYDIIVWIRKRKAENAQIVWQNLSSADLLMLSDEKKKNKKINCFLLIASVLGAILLLFFAIPLWAFTVARIIDTKLCYPNISR